MIRNALSVKHFVLSHVLLHPLRYFEEASFETIPSGPDACPEQGSAALGELLAELKTALMIGSY